MGISKRWLFAAAVLLAAPLAMDAQQRRNSGRSTGLVVAAIDAD